MKKILPDIKLIVILRNPVDRAYSDYNQFKHHINKKISFEKAIDMSKERCLKEKKQPTKYSNLDFNSYAHPQNSLLARGMHADQLENWFKYYNRKQFLFLSAEDFHKNTQETLDHVFSFLGLSQFKIDNPKRYNIGNYKKMNEDTRKSLIEYFKPHNERLYKLLQRGFDWDK